MRQIYPITVFRTFMLTVMACIFILLSACSSSDDAPSVSNDLFATAIADDRFSILAEAIVAANLSGALQSDGPLTVFAPNNDAFVALLSDLNLTKEALFNETALLSAVLQYHVVGAEVNAASALSVAQSPTNTIDSILIDGGTPAPIMLSIELVDGSNVLKLNDSSVVDIDIRATNGLIHEIDKVLLPPEFAILDIVEIAQNTDRFSILTEAVVAANLATTLKTAGPFTVFAPNNDAFNQLLSDLSLTKEALLADTALLTSVLQYHVLGGAVRATDALSVAASNDNLVDTLLQVGTFQPVALSTTDENNGTTLYINTSVVLNANIFATNGIIHEIDKVLLPPARDETNIATTIVGILSSDAELSTLNAAIGAAQLGGMALDVSALNAAGSFTLFAPTNDAFDALIAATPGVNDAGELVAALNDANDTLANVILQHVVPGLSIESVPAYAANGGQVPTLRTNFELPVLIEDGNLKVGGSTVTVTDIIASNGVIHKIDAVIVDGSVDVTP